MNLDKFLWRYVERNMAGEVSPATARVDAMLIGLETLG